MAMLDYLQWGTTPEKAYYNRLNSTLSGNVAPQPTVTYVQQGVPQNNVLDVNAELELPKFNPTSKYVAPAYVAPEEYVAPEYDENRVAALAQRKSAAGLRAARQALQQTVGGYYENPNVKRMTLRDALAGYGQSVESVLSGADTTAREEYNLEYGIKADQSKTNHNTDVQGSKIKYEGDVTAAQLKYQSALDAEKTNYNTLINRLTKQYEAQIADYMANTYGSSSSKSNSNASNNTSRIGYAYLGKPAVYDRNGDLVSEGGK
jgi:hypothetical protein